MTGIEEMITLLAKDGYELVIGPTWQVSPNGVEFSGYRVAVGTAFDDQAAAISRQPVLYNALADVLAVATNKKDVDDDDEYFPAHGAPVGM